MNGLMEWIEWLAGFGEGVDWMEQSSSNQTLRSWKHSRRPQHLATLTAIGREKQGETIEQREKF